MPLMPLADDAPVPSREWRQESGGRERNGDFGDSREERRHGANDPPWNRNINNKKNKPKANEKKRRGDWHQGGAGGGHPDRPWQRPFQGNLEDERPPCTVPQCKAINRQFHCANDCYFHPELGKLNRLRGGGKRRPSKANLDAEYDGCNNNSGFQGAPYTDGFGREHCF